MDSSINRIEKLEKRVSELEGLIQSIAVSMHFKQEEPFEAECVKRMITGEKRTALQIQIGIMLQRKSGADVSHYPRNLFPQFPSVIAATEQDFSSVDDMAKALVPIVGSEEAAIALLNAYRERGLGAHLW